MNKISFGKVVEYLKDMKELNDIEKFKLKKICGGKIYGNNKQA